MAKKKQATPLVDEGKQATETTTVVIEFDFKDSDRVNVIGVEGNKHQIKTDRVYSVSGVVAKILINKGAAVLAEKK